MSQPALPRTEPETKRVLVVSDNPELTRHFQETMLSLAGQPPARVDYRYSATNRAPEPMIALGATLIDVKSPDTVSQVLAEYDLVLSLHCKQIFPKQLVEGVRCINFHPGYNPHNRGWYPQAFSIINKLPVGVTIHLMDAEVDHGAVIDQRAVTVEPSDTSLEVYRKVIELEKELIRQHAASILAGTFRAEKPSGEGNYNGIADYKRLCALDLSSVGTLGEHLDLLRATTHAPFRNAYFFDADGNKYFVRISIERES